MYFIHILLKMHRCFLQVLLFSYCSLQIKCSFLTFCAFCLGYLELIFDDVASADDSERERVFEGELSSSDFEK